MLQLGIDDLLSLLSTTFNVLYRILKNVFSIELLEHIFLTLEMNFNIVWYRDINEI